MDGDRTPVPFLATEANERGGVFSPNGRWLAYVSDESGRDEVYVLPYPGPGRKHTISTNGGSEPAWAPTGRELFFRHEDEVLVVGVDTAGTLQPAAPVPLFAGAYVPDNSGGGRSVANYDVAPHGQRFLMLKAEGESGSRTRRIHVVDNWFEELKTRVPIP